MSDASKAIFLSYASQDAEAARRICETLRAEGVEVWFDADGGLEHGDEWDAKIRRQIKECVLFIPLISANTQAREEGYFRLEWDLAAERARTIASGVPFILPVVIDNTREPDALVPDRFRTVQWTKLPGGVVTPEVKARYLKLWSHRTGLLKQQQLEAGRPRPAGPGDDATPAGSQPTGRRIPAAAWIAVTLALVALVSWIALRPKSDREVVTRPLAQSHASAAPADKSALPLEEKSIVVLPLENLSPDPENAYFTDGIHAEIIATLQRSLPDLKVISRESALALKRGSAPLAELAQRVGVAYVLSGSVRRAGNLVRIQLELRRARDEALLWSLPKGDRELKDVMAVQTEIAEEVARLLLVRNAKGTFAGAAFATKDPRAFDLFLQSNAKFEEALKDGPGRTERFDQAIALAEQALALDPTYMTAASLRSTQHVFYFLRTRDTTVMRRQAAESKRWAETASRLMPGGAGDGALALYYHTIEKDDVKSLAVAQNAVRALPNDSLYQNRLGLALMGLGRTSETLPAFRRSLELDPLNPTVWTNQLKALADLRRSPEFEAIVAQAKSRVELDPRHLATLRFMLRGEIPVLSDKADDLLSRDPLWLTRAGKFDAALARVERFLATATSETTRLSLLQAKADLLYLVNRGQESLAIGAAAVELAEKLRELPDFDPSARDHRLARSYARANQAEKAIAAGRRFVEAASATTQTRDRWAREVFLAEIFARLERPQECASLLANLLRAPSGISVPMLKVDPVWARVRENPAFQALLADPRNSAPL